MIETWEQYCNAVSVLCHIRQAVSEGTGSDDLLRPVADKIKGDVDEWLKYPKQPFPTPATHQP
jgi:hypothetical protein